MEQSILRLQAEGVHTSLQAIQQIRDDLETNKQSLLAKLQAAEAGDPNNYLATGLNQGYAAIQASNTAIALLDDVLNNSRATVQNLEQHDQQTQAAPPELQQPVALQVTTANSGLTPVQIAAPTVERPEISVQSLPADVPLTPYPEPLIQAQVPIQNTVTMQSTLTGIASVPPLTAPMCSVTEIPPMVPEAAYNMPEEDTSLWGSVKGFFGDLWDGLRGTFDGLKEWFAENFGSIKELAATYYQWLKEGNILAWLGLFVIVGIGILALIGVGIVVVALKFILLAAVVIGAIVGVVLIGYNIYQIFANPDLTPYERGKLVGKSIGELIFLLPAGIFKAPRLIKLLSKAGRLFKTSKISGILSKAGVLLRTTSSKLVSLINKNSKLSGILSKAGVLLRTTSNKLAPLNIFNKTSKIRGVIHLLSKIRKPSDLQFIRQFKSIDTAAEYLRYFGSFDTAVQFANKVGDAEQALVILRRAGNYEAVIYISNLPKNPIELLNRGWIDITDPRMAVNTNMKEFTDPVTNLRVRFDPGKPGNPGFEGIDHYHVYNPYSTSKRDLYLDKNGNPVSKGSKASHIVP